MEFNKIYNEDCLQTMGNMPDCFIDLTVTSPPYGTLRKYNGFSFDFHAAARLLYEKTKAGGVLVWVCSDMCIDGGESMASFEQALYFRELGFRLYDTMIWRKPSPQAPTEGRYYDVFEYMFVFSKGAPKSVNLLQDRPNSSVGKTARVESRSCREDRFYTDKMRATPEYSRRFNVWDISRGHNKTEHPAVFPLELAIGHVLSWSNFGDLVYDPFMGSGTTALAAFQNERRYIGSEISEEYCKIAERRLNILF